MKSQAAIEYLVLMSLIIFFLIPLLYYSTSESANTIKLNDAQDAVQSLVKTADYVYSLGPGTKTNILITIPEGVYNISIKGYEIILNLGGYGEIVGKSKANLTGNLSSSKGNYQVKVELLENGMVNIKN